MNKRVLITYLSDCVNLSNKKSKEVERRIQGIWYNNDSAFECSKYALIGLTHTLSILCIGWMDSFNSFAATKFNIEHPI